MRRLKRISRVACRIVGRKAAGPLPEPALAG